MPADTTATLFEIHIQKLFIFDLTRMLNSEKQLVIDRNLYRQHSIKTVAA